MRSQQATGPILGGVNCSAVTIGMIVNGFMNMEGITPYRPMEEIGLNLFDYQLNGFGNWQFSVAGAGTYGLRAHVEYNDRHATDNLQMMETILRHLVSGHAVGLSLQFSGVPGAPHFISRVDGTTNGHLIVLLGVVQRSGNWYVISYEPWSGSGANANDRVYRELPMQELVNAMRFSGANGTHNIIYVVKPGVETEAATATPTRLESYLVPTAPGEFGLSIDGTSVIPIGGMDRGQIGGPSGFIAYTIDPAFNFMGASLTNPHGQGGTKFRYLPIGDRVRFGYDAHIAPVQPFTYQELTNPNFRMYIMMGNGFTHVIDSTRVASVNDFYPELESPGAEFRVNNPMRTVSPYSVPLVLGVTTIGEIISGLEAKMGGTFAIFSEGTTIASIADFNAATPKSASELLQAGDFIVAVNNAESRFVIFEIDHFGLGFERSSVNEIVRLDFYNFTREGSSNFYPWSNLLTGWEDPLYPGRTVVYTADRVSVRGGASLDTFPLNMIDGGVHGSGLRSIADSGVGNMPIRFVEANAAYPGGFRLIPYSTTGEIMPWRGPMLVRITASVSGTDSSDPFDGESRSFYVQVIGGGPGANGGNMRLGEYVTGTLISPSFTWGTFRAPVDGVRTYNLNFSNTAVMPGPSINTTGRPLAPISFPYTPYAGDRPYWTFNTTWDGSVYTFATSTSVSWFWQPEEGPRQPVPLDSAHGYVFQPGTVYIAELFLATPMHPRNQTWFNMPAAGFAFDTFVSNIAGLPAPGEDGIANIAFSRNANHLLQATITFEQLPGERPQPGPIDQLGFEHSNVGETVSLSFLDVTRADSPNFYPWANRLTGWDGPGHVVYTVSSDHVALVDANLNIVTSNQTGAIMPFRGNAEGSPVTVTATIYADNPEDPFDGLSVSYGVWVRAGGYPGANGRPMNAAEGFTWGTFAAPAAGAQAWNVAFCNETPNALVPFNSDPIPSDANVVFPYTPYLNERPLFVLGQTWDGTPYNSGIANRTRVSWFREVSEGVREAVPQGHVFTANTVYIADLILAANMTPTNGSWINFPPLVHAEGNTFDVFINSARDLPVAGQNGVRDFEVIRNSGWNTTFRLTFEPLEGEELPPTPEFPLTVLASVGGEAVVNVDGTFFTGGMFSVGTPLTLMATPDRDYRFVYWTIDGVDFVGDITFPAADFEMPSNAVTVMANFERSPSIVSTVRVYPADIEVELGTTQQFAATVSGIHHPPSQEVIWSVEGNNSLTTTISSNGLLFICENETATTLTITAVSVADSSRAGTTTVNVVDDTPLPFYGISLSVTGIYTFSSAFVGYDSSQALSVIVSNTGNQPTGELSVLITGDAPDSFVLSTTTINSILVGSYYIFTIAPEMGLSARNHLAMINVDGANVWGGFMVNFNVNPADVFPIGFATNNVTQNGLTAFGTIAHVGAQPEGEEITLTVTLNGTATAAGTHGISISSESLGHSIPYVLINDVAAGDVFSAEEYTFIFTMPAHAVADLAVVHTFTPANITTPTQPLPAPTGLNITDRVVSWNAVNNAAAYHVYVNGSRVAVVNAPATSFNLATLGLAAGTHTVQVRAIGTGNFTNSGLSSSLTLTITAPPTEPDPTPNVPSVGSGNWSPSVPSVQNQATTNVARQNHTSIQNQLTTLATADVAGTPAVVMTVAANNELALQGSSLAALVQAGTPLVVRSANGIFEAMLPVAFLSEFHSRGLTNGEFVISVVYVDDGNVLAVGEFEFIARNNAVARFQNSYTIIANLENRIPANMNRARITGVHNERNLGGSFSQGSRFEFDTNMTGTFAVAHVNTLRRISVALDSYVLTDLAGNAPTQTMDVIPVIQNDRTLLPIRFMAYALGAEVDWNEATSEVTLTLDGETLTFAIGEMAPGMDVPAQIMNERTMVPLRFISEFFGAVVLWDDATRSIEIVR